VENSKYLKSQRAAWLSAGNISIPHSLIDLSE
jgi:hypothetical protein